MQKVQSLCSYLSALLLSSFYWYILILMFIMTVTPYDAYVLTQFFLRLVWGPGYTTQNMRINKKHRPWQANKEEMFLQILENLWEITWNVTRHIQTRFSRRDQVMTAFCLQLWFLIVTLEGQVPGLSTWIFLDTYFFWNHRSGLYHFMKNLGLTGKFYHIRMCRYWLVTNA